jgi:hypothetical protein
MQGVHGVIQSLFLFDVVSGYMKQLPCPCTWLNMVEIVNKLIRVSRQLVQELGREPTSLEMAKGMQDKGYGDLMLTLEQQSAFA